MSLIGQPLTLPLRLSRPARQFLRTTWPLRQQLREQPPHVQLQRWDSCACPAHISCQSLPCRLRPGLRHKLVPGRCRPLDSRSLVLLLVTMSQLGSGRATMAILRRLRLRPLMCTSMTLSSSSSSRPRLSSPRLLRLLQGSRKGCCRALMARWDLVGHRRGRYMALPALRQSSRQSRALPLQLRRSRRPGRRGLVLLPAAGVPASPQSPPRPRHLRRAPLLALGRPLLAAHRRQQQALPAPQCWLPWPQLLRRQPQ